MESGRRGIYRKLADGRLVSADAIFLYPKDGNPPLTIGGRYHYGDKVYEVDTLLPDGRAIAGRVIGDKPAAW